jgi:hypothetical protein
VRGVQWPDDRRRDGRPSGMCQVRPDPARQSVQTGLQGMLFFETVFAWKSLNSYR